MLGTADSGCGASQAGGRRTSLPSSTQAPGSCQDQKSNRVAAPAVCRGRVVLLCWPSVDRRCLILLDTMAAHPSPRQRYREGRVLGRGAFGVVRIARDAVSGEDVVVKRVARPYVAAWSTSSTFHLFSPSPTHGHSLKHLLPLVLHVVGPLSALPSPLMPRIERL